MIASARTSWILDTSKNPVCSNNPNGYALRIGILRDALLSLRVSCIRAVATRIGGAFLEKPQYPCRLDSGHPYLHLCIKEGNWRALPL